MDTAYVNGAFVPLGEASVSILDRGLLFADSVYEVVPVYAGKPFLLDAHLRRLDASLAGIRLKNPYAQGQWRALLGDLIARNGAGDLAVYLQVTRGAGARREHRAVQLGPATVIAFCQVRSGPAPALLEQGAAAITRPDTRWARCDIKSTALLANILLADDAHREDAEEAILYRGENITEGSSSNVFAVCNGVVTTPPLGPTILAGITRAEVLRLARAHAIPCVEATLTRSELAGASELWLTSSTRELLPVTRLDGAAVGDGRPGPQRARLQALLRPPSPA